MRKTVVVSSLAVALAAVAAAKIYGRTTHAPAQTLASSPLGPLLLSGPAPEIDSPDPSGRPISLSDLRGKVVVLNFWYTDCEPCRDEMPSLDALARAVASRGVEVVALSVDPSWEKVRAFLAADPHLRGKEPAFRMALDREKKVPPRYGTFKFPETFLVSREGRLLARFVGPRDWSTPDARRLIESLAR